MRLVDVAVLLLVMSSCAEHPARVTAPVDASPPYAFFPPVGFEDGDQEAITGAMEQWNVVTNASHKLGWSDYGHLRFVPHLPPGEGFVGRWWDIGLVFIAPGAPVGEVALHELGHVIGLGHVGEPSAVMCSSVDFEVACEPHIDLLTTADITECRSVGACP